MIPEDLSALQQGGVVGTVGAAIVALAFGVRWALNTFGVTRTQMERSSAEFDVISGLRDEVRRLSDQNDKLADRLNQMQLQTLDLHTEIGKLRTENAALRAEIQQLHAEITRLRGAE